MAEGTKLQEIFRLHRDCTARFGGYVLRLLMEDNDDKENIALSPVRLQAILVLLANWTTPEIRKQILDMAVSDIISLDEANILFDFANVKPIPQEDLRLRDKDGNYISLIPTLEQQMTLWHKVGLTVNTMAVEKLKSAFNACVKAIDFAKSKNIIDEDVRKATHGLIQHLDTNITPSMQALIVDILYFKGAWRPQFNIDNTANHVFYGTKKRQIVPTMSMQGYMEYEETPVYQAVNLPYVCESTNHRYFAMRIYLPQGRQTINDVFEEKWNSEYEFHGKREEVKLSLPRFEVSSKNDVKAILKNMGLSCLLNSNDIIPECIEGLQIADIVQQVKIKVDENGTEATAVTLPSHKFGLFKKVKPKVMKVNRPFLFEIVEETTNVVLFSGIINNIK